MCVDCPILADTRVLRYTGWANARRTSPLDHTITETTFEEVAGLVDDVVSTGAFVERKSDEAPFVLEAPAIFAGHRWYRIFAVSDPAACPVGFLMTVPGREPDAVDIGPTYVCPQQRGLGLGQLLVAHAVEWARSEGADRVVVATWGKNARARHVFENAGFTFSGEELDTRVNGDSTVHYQIVLSDRNTEP